jgi:hypothetical protein
MRTIFHDAIDWLLTPPTPKKKHAELYAYRFTFEYDGTKVYNTNIISDELIIGYIPNFFSSELWPHDEPKTTDVGIKRDYTEFTYTSYLTAPDFETAKAMLAEWEIEQNTKNEKGN